PTIGPGSPPGLVTARSFPLAAANPVMVGTEPGSPGLGPNQIFNYTWNVPIAAPLSLAAGTYWISIVPDTDFPPQWGWRRAAWAGDGSIKDFNVPGVLVGRTRNDVAGNPLSDLAFTIVGPPTGAIPEPATVVLWSLFGVLTGGYAWRRRRSAAV